MLDTRSVHLWVATAAVFSASPGCGSTAATTPDEASKNEGSNHQANNNQANNNQANDDEGSKTVTSLHEMTARTIEGVDQPLSAYRGKVALVVNTASECGFTPQYSGLEELWKKYKDQGVVVLGFPSNDFGGQEPGSDSDIQSFCEVRYGVTFPLFSKSAVKGSGASPVFRFLAASHGEPKWNFHKYVVGKDGEVIAAFPSDTTPDDPALAAAIETAAKAN